MEGSTPREREEPNDNVLDLRVARWRHDPFMAEMLEIIEKLSRCNEEERGWALIRMRTCLRAAEKEAATGAKIEG